MKEKKCGIYMIKNLVTGRVYVGSSVNIKKRWQVHKELLKNGKHHNSYLQNSYNKYGRKYFKFSVIEECGINKLEEREQYWYEFFKENGLVYNMRLEFVNSNRGRKLSEDHKKNISIGGKGKKKSPMSEETKRKLREANLGRKHSEETKKIMSEQRKGHTVTEETKRKIVETRMRNNSYKHSEETIRKMSESAKCRLPMSEETKRKIGNKSRGRKHSEESKRKISESLKKYNKEYKKNRKVKEVLRKSEMQKM